IALLTLSACSTNYPNRDPVGETFPQVQGTTLEQETVTLPDYFSGEHTVLLLGYEQDAQFDIDRWLIGLDMTETDAPVYELPTIAGMFPQFFETQINEGMRKGIPKELWKGVITIFEGGDKVQQFTGNTNPNSARAMVIDESGEVVYFHDQGFSVGALNAMRAILPTGRM
ncbi:MAG: hypothetical protein ACQEQZ_09355, partial [Pseudomonadota bacterium]